MLGSLNIFSLIENIQNYVKKYINGINIQVTAFKKIAQKHIRSIHLNQS